jgi:predicted amidohydrolase
LKRQHTGLLIGTTVPIPDTEANRNVLLSRGYTERYSYVQRVPVPLGMWHFGDEHHGFPPMLRFPPTIRVWNHRAGVLICYEQLLVWPALESLARNPDMLLAPSNLYWAAGTPIPAIQHISAQDWADLWAIPVYEASNR